MSKHFILIRDKLGDTVIAFQALAAFRAAHPNDSFTVMVHAHYLPIFCREPGCRLVPYHSFLQAIAWALWQRITMQRFDSVVVLRGFGHKVAKLARMLLARQRIHALNRFPEVFQDSPPPPEFRDESVQTHIAPALRALRVLDSRLVAPDRLDLPGLQFYRQIAKAVVLCPVSDEIRRSLAPDDVARLLPEVRQRHPGLAVWILVRNSGEGGFVAGNFSGAEVLPFGSIERLLELLGQAAAYYGSDTGLYHVAAAMGLPSVIFFGPSQPYKVILPGQSTKAVRLAALGQLHCDLKTCKTPVCIQQATASWSSQPHPIIPFPAGCPLPVGGSNFSLLDAESVCSSRQT